MIDTINDWINELEDDNLRYGQHRMNIHYKNNEVIIAYLKTRVRKVKKDMKNVS